jgi:demethylmenaquinone methyltransferase/2-methoxy-6-polyprenyl-1,4-benzoquinol methylase
VIEETISPEAARRFYDRLGQGHDWAERYEGRAKKLALARLDLSPGQRVLNVGVGTGQEHAQIQSAVTPDGLAFGLDLSPVMLKLTQDRLGVPLCEANAGRLPFTHASFDRLFSTYVLDLISAAQLPSLLTEFHRLLKPGGRLALVSLTEGVTLPSKILVGLWKMAYAVSPVACGGCRPVQLAGLVGQAGFSQVEREVVVQLGIPSEIIVARRPLTAGR